MTFESNAAYDDITMKVDGSVVHPTGREVKALPRMLQGLFGGDLELVTPCRASHPAVFASFVVSREGIFNLKDNLGGGPISQGNRADAFLLALLRAIADAILIGPGTLKAEPNHKWHLAHIFDTYPQMHGLEAVQKELEEYREKLGGKSMYPPTIVMTSSGNIDPSAAIFSDPDIKTYVVSGREGAARAAKLLGSTTTTGVIRCGNEKLDLEEMLRTLKRELGVNLLYYQGGRKAFEGLVKKNLVSQLFLSQMQMSPRGNLDPENVQYLFSAGDRTYPEEAKVLSRRMDGTHRLTLWNLDFRSVRSL